MKKQSYTFLFLIGCLLLIKHSVMAQKYSNRYTEYKRTIAGENIPFTDTFKIVNTNDSMMILRIGNNALGYNGILRNNILDLKYKIYNVDRSDIDHLKLESDGQTHYFNRELVFDINTIDYVKTVLPRTDQKYTDIADVIKKHNWKIFKILNSYGHIWEFEEVIRINDNKNNDGLNISDTTIIVPDDGIAFDAIKTTNEEIKFYTISDQENPSYRLHSINGHKIILINTHNNQLLELQAYHYDPDSWVLVNRKLEMYMWVKKAHQ